MRAFACLLALIVLAACAGEREPHITSPVAARFADGTAGAPEIEITASDRQPMETAELIAPDGSAIPAHQIDRNKTVEETRGGAPSVGVGVFGGSSGRVGTSIGIGFPLFGDDEQRDAVIDSRALIRVPDMNAYRAGWQHYRLRLRFGLPENERVMEIPAPRPPEG